MVRYRGAEMEPLGNYTQTNTQIQNIIMHIMKNREKVDNKIF